MAQNGTIFHSADLSDGVSPGWTAIGENVAAAGSIEAAQRALEQSPDHYENLVNPDFKELGVGVTVRNGTVYLVQIFVGR
ncbi:MAG: CAP domain-containing protein [Ilumatobacteraceae bacterium]